VADKVTVNDLIERVDSIRDQVINLFHLHYMFWEVQKIVKSNDKLSNINNHFFDWMIETFAISAGMYVRRQVDIRRNTVSLHRLLNDLSKQPLLITREYFVGKWAGTQPRLIHEQMVATAEELFDIHVGHGKTHIEKGLIQADIKQLVDTCELAKTLADDYYAHNSAKPSTMAERPQFSHLTSCMNCLELLLRKYYLLIKGEMLPSISNVEETFAYSWRDIFTIPWIEDSKTESTKRVAGLNRGMIWTGDDFDAPLPDDF